MWGSCLWEDALFVLSLPGTYCQLNRVWPDREQAKSVLFSVVNLSLRWTARIPCWVPLKHARVLFISVGLSLLALWPPSFCFCICYLFMCVPFHQTGWQNHLCVKEKNGNCKGQAVCSKGYIKHGSGRLFPIGNLHNLWLV